MTIWICSIFIGLAVFSTWTAPYTNGGIHQMLCFTMDSFQFLWYASQWTVDTLINLISYICTYCIKFNHFYPVSVPTEINMSIILSYSCMNAPSSIIFLCIRLEFADLMENFRDKISKLTIPVIFAMVCCLLVCLVEQKKPPMSNVKLTNINYYLLTI